MSDTRELLDFYASETDFNRGDLLDDREFHAPKTFAALRAVLELHKPITPRAPQDVAAECAECYDISASPWPCRTVEAITKALEAAE